MGAGNRNKVFSLSLLDQTFLQLFDYFPEMFVLTKPILKLDYPLTHRHRAPLKMLGNISYPVARYNS
jgi:hypothetical protein